MIRLYGRVQKSQQLYEPVLTRLNTFLLCCFGFNPSDGGFASGTQDVLPCLTIFDGRSEKLTAEREISFV